MRSYHSESNVAYKSNCDSKATSGTSSTCSTPSCCDSTNSDDAIRNMSMTTTRTNPDDCAPTENVNHRISSYNSYDIETGALSSNSVIEMMSHDENHDHNRFRSETIDNTSNNNLYRTNPRLQQRRRHTHRAVRQVHMNGPSATVVTTATTAAAGSARTVETDINYDVELCSSIGSTTWAASLDSSSVLFRAVSQDPTHSSRQHHILRLFNWFSVSKLRTHSSSSKSSSVWSRAERNRRHGIQNVQFRTICPTDKNQIQQLHEQWFPVRYMDEFYDDLVYERMTGTGDPLFTSVGYITTDSNSSSSSCYSTTIPQQQHLEPWTMPSISTQIVACVVGCFVPASSLSGTLRNILIHNPNRHTKLFYIMTVGTTIKHAGIGTILIQHCIDQVRKDPACGVLYLHVLTTNIAAIHMYERLGFYRVQEIPNYYTIDLVPRNCYLYAKYYHGNRGHRALSKLIQAKFFMFWSFCLYMSSLWKNHITDLLFICDDTATATTTSTNNDDDDDDTNNHSLTQQQPCTLVDDNVHNVCDDDN
jgi:histone acetyltransferase MCC1